MSAHLLMTVSNVFLWDFTQRFEMTGGHFRPLMAGCGHKFRHHQNGNSPVSSCHLKIIFLLIVTDLTGNVLLFILLHLCFSPARKSSNLFSWNLPCISRALLRKSSVKTLVVSLLVVGPHLFEKWAHCFQMDYSSFISPLCFPLSLSKVIASPPVSQTRLGLLCAKCAAPFWRAWVLLSAQWTRLVGSGHS